MDVVVSFLGGGGSQETRDDDPSLRGERFCPRLNAPSPSLLDFLLDLIRRGPNLIFAGDAHRARQD